MTALYVLGQSLPGSVDRFKVFPFFLLILIHQKPQLRHDFCWRRSAFPDIRNIVPWRWNTGLLLIFLANTTDAHPIVGPSGHTCGCVVWYPHWNDLSKMVRILTQALATYERDSSQAS